jgi:hypothetical protein
MIIRFIGWFVYLFVLLWLAGTVVKAWEVGHTKIAAGFLFLGCFMFGIFAEMTRDLFRDLFFKKGKADGRHYDKGP